MRAAPSLTLLSLTMLILLHTSLVMSHPAISPQPSPLRDHMIRTRSRSRHYCGGQLTEIMQFVCNGEYFSPINSKRNHQKDGTITNNKQDQYPNGILSFWGNDDVNPNHKAPSENTGPFIDPKRAFSLISGNDQNRYFRRNVRGLSHECCEKPCTLSEMSSYCDAPNEQVEVEVEVEKRETKGLFESLFHTPDD